MKFKIGDRVQRNYYRNELDYDANAVRTGDMGTVFHIFNKNLYGVRWDIKRPDFYEQSGYENTWIIYAKYIELAGPPKSKEDLIIEKIKELNTRFSERKHVATV